MQVRRQRADVLEAVRKITQLVESGTVPTLQAAIDHVGLSKSTYHKYQRDNNIERETPMAKGRRSTMVVEQLTRKAHALVQHGVTIEEATKRIGLARSVYEKNAKRLGLPPRGATTGSVRADMLPPRPGKGGKREPRPVDMNSVESLAKRMLKIDKLLDGVNDLKKERKKIAGRLRSLLKV